MILAFGEAIAALGLLGVLGACVAVIMFCIYRVCKKKRLTGVMKIGGALAFVPFLILFASSLHDGDREYNPLGMTLDEISGVYIRRDMKITLNKDGTYSSENVVGLSSGTWSNFDWNLSFEPSDLSEARWITRNGIPAILPHYSSMYDSDGVLLTKQ